MRLTFLWARLRSCRSPIGCFVLIFLHAPVCCFRLQCQTTSLQSAFGPNKQRHAPRIFYCEPEHLQIFACYVHSLRCGNMFFHLQLFLGLLVHHHDLSSETFSIHPAIVCVLAPRHHHDHLQIASLSSLPRSHPPDRSCEPHAVLVPPRNIGILGGTRMSGKSCNQHHGHKEIDGIWTCRSLTAQLCEIGLEFAENIVKSDNKPTFDELDRVMEHTLRAMKSGSRMIMEKSTRHFKEQRDRRASRTIRSAIEEKCEVKTDVTHSASPCVTEQSGFLFTKFERDGKKAYERLKSKSAKVQGLSFAEGIFWKTRRAGGPLRKMTCMWASKLPRGKSSPSFSSPMIVQLFWDLGTQQENEQQELYSAPWSQGDRRDNGYVEGWRRGCVR